MLEFGEKNYAYIFNYIKYKSIYLIDIIRFKEIKN